VTKHALTTFRSSQFDKLGEIYVAHPVMRTLAALAGVVPPVSVLDEAVVARWNQAKQERFKALLEELSKGARYLTEDLIEQEDFIYAFHAISRAAVFTKNKQKVQLFARLLTYACREKLLDNDKFEENLHILEDLSLREMQLLLLFKKHEDRLRERTKGPSDDFRRVQWEALQEEAESKLGIPRQQLESSLARLTRSGWYVPYFPQVPSEKVLGNGYTSSRLIEFMQWVKEADDRETSAYV
jgi:hypothetical protein